MLKHRCQQIKNISKNNSQMGPKNEGTKYTTRTLLETFPRARYQALHQNFLGRSLEFALISGQSLLSVATEEGKTTVTSSVFFLSCQLIRLGPTSSKQHWMYMEIEHPLVPLQHFLQSPKHPPMLRLPSQSVLPLIHGCIDDMKYTTRTVLETFPRARYQALHQNFQENAPT